MATFGQWLDDYDGEDNIVAGVARIWRTAKTESDARPRVSAPQSITGWLAGHRRVADESLRAAVRAYNESRGGRQATEAEVGAFKAMNSPGTIAPVPGDHEQPAGPSPAMMAILGRIEQGMLGGFDALDQRLERLEAWTKLQDERIKPITDLLGELAEAEQAPDQGEQVTEADLAQETAPAVYDERAGEYHPGPAMSIAPPAQVTGSLWRNIAAQEPDMDRMAQLGDPRLVEDEP